MASNRITRHFATITDGRWGPRQVHYRRVGKGPVVVLLHQSPLSSRDMLATMERWKTQFTCIAPDHPGYGLSDPLGVESAEMPDFAQATIEFLDAIGVQKAAFYGFHTGAMIAVSIAENFPERTTCAAANGYVVLTKAERDDIVANYLPSFEPKWDGSHLTWLWARMREQTVFFPWYRKSLEDRMDIDMPSPEALHIGALDMMRSGNHHRVGYRAAFTMRSDESPRKIRVPTLITASKFDPLGAQMPRITQHSASVTLQLGGDGNETLDLCRDFIRKHKPPSASGKIMPTAPLRGRLWQQYIDVPGGQLRVRRNDDAPGRPVLVQHDAAGSSEVVQHLAAGFIGKRPVIAINLPGHGESDNTLPKGKVTVTGYAKVVLAALKSLGVKDFDFIGTWGGGLVGLELGLLAPKRLKRLVMCDVLYFDAKLRKELIANYTPDIQPNWYGGHLLQAWHLMRDQGLFWPWYRRTRAGAIRKPLYIDPVMVNGRVLELFRSNGMWRQAYQAHFSYPLAAKLKQLKLPLVFAAPPWDPQLEDTQRAAQDFPHSPFQLLPSDMQQWAGTLLPFFNA